MKMRREVELKKGKGFMDGASSSSNTLPTFAAVKQTAIVVNRPEPDVTQDRSDWNISEDHSILQVIRDHQGISPSLTILMPSRTPNWDLAADAVNALSPVYRSAKKCKSRFENVIMLREESNEIRKQTSHLYQKDSNTAYTSIFLKRSKVIFQLDQKRKAQSESVKIQIQTQKFPKGLSVLNAYGINYCKPLSPMEITSNRQEHIQREKQKNQPAGQVQLRKANLQPGSAIFATLSKPLTNSIIVSKSFGTATFATITKALGPSGISNFAQGAVQNAANAAPCQVRNLRTSSSGTSSAPAVVSVAGLATVQLAPSQRITGTAATTVATAVANQMNSQITTQDNITQLSQIKAIRQAALIRQKNAANAAPCQVRNLRTSSSGTSSTPAVVSVAGLATVQLAPSQRITGTAATTVATAVANQMNSQITTQDNITQLSQIKAIRQAALIRQKGKSGVQTKGATTITNQQLRQLQIQQKLLNQDRKGTTNLTRLAKVTNKGFLRTTASISAPVNVISNSQQVKGLPTTMTGQQMQQAMKAMPQNLPVVVTATPSLIGIQHTATTLCQEPGVVASSVKAQTTTLPSTTLTTSNVLKGTPAVIVAQQQTAAILQQAPASSSGITGQHAVQARASQAQGQQFPIQVQPYAHSFLVTPQAQVIMPQTRIQQLSQNASTINIAQQIAMQNEPQASIILSPSGTIVQQMPANSTIQSSTHVVMHTVAITNTTSTNTALSSPQTTSVQAVIQAARQQQQQQAAVQQQKAFPFTMRLHDPQN